MNFFIVYFQKRKMHEKFSPMDCADGIINVTYGPEKVKNENLICHATRNEYHVSVLYILPNT